VDVGVNITITTLITSSAVCVCKAALDKQKLFARLYETDAELVSQSVAVTV